MDTGVARRSHKSMDPGFPHEGHGNIRRENRGVLRAETISKG